MRADVRAVRIEGGVLAELYAQHASDALRLAYLLTGDASLRRRPGAGSLREARRTDSCTCTGSKEEGPMPTSERRS